MMPVILMTVLFLGCIFAFALTPDRPTETKKKPFEVATRGTASPTKSVPPLYPSVYGTGNDLYPQGEPSASSGNFASQSSRVH